jgi:hypothetical protein
MFLLLTPGALLQIVALRRTVQSLDINADAPAILRLGEAVVDQSIPEDAPRWFLRAGHFREKAMTTVLR